MTSSVELTQDLVRFRTINPPGDERACAERLASLLENAGFAVDLVPFGEGRAQLVARIGGASGKPAIGSLGISILCRSVRSYGPSTRWPPTSKTASFTDVARPT